MNVCKKICNECPFSNKSMKGWLANYTINDIIEIQSNELLFPCHMMMSDNDMTFIEVSESIKEGKLKLCRGYVESMIKSCKLPRHNTILINAILHVKKEGISKNSLSIQDFKNHHKLN